MAGQIKVTLKRSTIGSTEVQKKVVQSLGLTKRGRSRVHPDNPAIRGMINKVSHLLECEEA